MQLYSPIQGVRKKEEVVADKLTIISLVVCYLNVVFHFL